MRSRKSTVALVPTTGYRLEVSLVGAEGLSVLESGRAPDAFVSLRLSGFPEVYTSETRRKSCSPVFMEDFSFFVASLEPRTLELRVQSRGSRLGGLLWSHTALGLVRVKLDLARLVVDEEGAAAQPHRYQLACPGDAEDSGAASVTVKLRVVALDDWSELLEARKRPIIPSEVSEHRARTSMRVLATVRPIVANVQLILYAIARPLFWILVEHRSVLVEYHYPGLALLFHCAYVFTWYHGRLAAFLLAYAFARMARVVYVGRRHRHSSAEEPPWKLKERAELAAEYIEAKAALLRRNDPVSVLAMRINNTTRAVGLRAMELSDAVTFYGDAVGARILMVMGILTVCFAVLPMWHILGWLIHWVMLLGYLWVVAARPLTRRFPELPAWLLGLVGRIRFSRGPSVVHLPAAAREMAPVELSSTSLEEGEDERMWKHIIARVGTKITLKKGEKLGEQGSVPHAVYRLVGGKLKMRNVERDNFFVLSAPETVLAGSMLLGHGVVRYNFSAHSPICRLVRVATFELRAFLQEHSELGEIFWRQLAVDLSMELKLKTASKVELTPSSPQKPSRHALLREMSVIVGEGADEREAMLFRSRFGRHVSGDSLSVFASCTERPSLLSRHAEGKVYISTRSPYYLAFWPQGSKSKRSWIHDVGSIVSTRLHKSHLEVAFRKKRTVRLEGADAQATQEISRVLREAMDKAAVHPARGERDPGHSAQASGCLSVALHGVEITAGSATSGVPSISLTREVPSLSSIEKTMRNVELARIHHQRCSVLDGADRIALLESEEKEALLQFSPGEIIVEEGKVYDPSVYLVNKGTVKVWKGDDFVTEVGESALLGEVSFYLRDPASATLKAGDHGKTEVRRYTSNFLESLAVADPGLSARFHEFLCYVIASRLQTMHASPKGSPSEEEDDESSY